MSGSSVAMNTGAPSGTTVRATATERPGVSGTPSAPGGPIAAAVAPSGTWRKNT